MNLVRSIRRSERGFTLTEILVVLVIIGILAAVGTVALTGARETGSQKACETDLATLRTAAEAYYTKTAPSAYGNEFALRADGVLGQFSTRHDLTVGASQSAANAASNAESSSATGAYYSIKVADADCGTVGQVVS